jgi:metal-sulfur cluster biosynthetic enzyme
MESHLKVSKNTIFAFLTSIIDPELNVDIVSLGLIYEIVLDDTGKNGSSVLVKMTLTTPGCPLAGMFYQRIREGIEALDGVDPKKVEVEFVFDPPWHPGLMTEEAKLQLGWEES